MEFKEIDNYWLMESQNDSEDFDVMNVRKASEMAGEQVATFLI